MNFWNESSTTVKTLLIVSLVVILGLAVALFIALSDTSEPASTASGAVPTFTPAPTAEPSPSGPVLVANTTVNVRVGPGTEYLEVGSIQENQSAPIIGRNENGTWYAMSYAGTPNNQGWVAAEFVTVQGAESVPVLAAPPPVGDTTAPTPPAESALPPADDGTIEIPDSQIIVTIDGQPAAIQIVGGIPNFSARVGQTVRLDASPAQTVYPALQVVWDMGDGAPPLTGIVVEYQYATAAVYEIAIAATDGEQSATKLWQVNVTD